jgi:ribonuclease HIII
MPPVPAAAALRGTVIGTDEAGKGDYFGPLVIAAVAVTPDVATPLSRLGVIDSKQLSDAKMCVLARQIEDMLGTDCCSVVAIGPPNYNAWYEALRARGEHLNHLMAWGHAEVVARILQAQPHLATLETTMLTDQFGNARYVANQVKERGLGVRLVQQPRAESAHVAVAAASILARVRFVAAVAQLSEMVGQTLPLGAGPPVLAAGRKLVARQGVEVLSRVAKCHFKTTMAITA